MSALYLTDDLMFSSRVTEAARASNLRVDVVSSSDRLFQHLQAQEDVELVVLDLSTPGIDVSQLTSRIRQHCGRATAIVAYAPHVHQSRLAAAHECDCDEVLTRGQFSSQLHQLLTKYVGA